MEILFNLDKSAVVIFESKTEPIRYGECKGVCECGRHLKFGEGFIVEETEKYLGIEFGRECTLSAFKARILDSERIGLFWVTGTQER